MLERSSALAGRGTGTSVAPSDRESGTWVYQSSKMIIQVSFIIVTNMSTPWTHVGIYYFLGGYSTENFYSWAHAHWCRRIKYKAQMPSTGIVTHGLEWENVTQGLMPEALAGRPGCPFASSGGWSRCAARSSSSFRKCSGFWSCFMWCEVFLYLETSKKMEYFFLFRSCLMGLFRKFILKLEIM